MERSKLGLVVLRALLLLFALVVLGTSAHFVHLINLYLDECDGIYGNDLCDANGFDGFQASLDFSVFVGLWGILQALIGFGQAFTDISTLWLVTIAFDGLATIFYLADGINLAVKIGNLDGCVSGLCSEIQADTAFAFLGFFASLAAVGLLFMARK